MASLGELFVIGRRSCHGTCQCQGGSYPAQEFPVPMLRLPLADAKARTGKCRCCVSVELKPQTDRWNKYLGKFGAVGRIEATWAESQWIVAARPLCHLQYPVAYLSRLQRILPAARWELRFKATRRAYRPNGCHQRHVPLGGQGPLLLVGK